MAVFNIDNLGRYAQIKYPKSLNEQICQIFYSFINSSFTHLIDSNNWNLWSIFYMLLSPLLGDGNLDQSPWVTHHLPTPPTTVGSRTLSWWEYPRERGTGQWKEICQIQLCYLTVLPKAGTSGARRCPTSTTTGEVCKSYLEKGKLTSEIQDSLESMISFVENKFSLAFEKCYIVNALVAESN